MDGWLDGPVTRAFSDSEENKLCRFATPFVVVSQNNLIEFGGWLNT